MSITSRISPAIAGTLCGLVVLGASAAMVSFSNQTPEPAGVTVIADSHWGTPTPPPPPPAPGPNGTDDSHWG